jgi:hypothetical protein
VRLEARGVERDALRTGGGQTRPVVVIHTNDQQLIPAKVSAHSLRTRSAHPDLFDVHILRLEETPALLAREGQRYVRWPGGRPSVWRRSDLDSFQLLRRMVPAVLGYTGRALVIDPDVFAVGDVYDLLSADMGGRAVLCRERPKLQGGETLYSSAVMLLDCALLTAWQPERELGEVFSGRRELGPLFALLDLDPDVIGLFGDEWNDHDNLTLETKLLHNTKVTTQPWRTGLRSNERGVVPPLPHWLAWWWFAARRVLSAGRRKPLHHIAHPDPQQERLFFTLLDECVRTGEITTDELWAAAAKRYLSSDVIERLRTFSEGFPTTTVVGDPMGGSGSVE